MGPFTIRGEHFAAWDGTRYRRFFVRAVNMGAALPGAGPNDLNATEEQYLRWFHQMREGGFNAVRVYTLQFPRFYRALATHNRAHPEAPILLVHGIWMPEPEGGAADLHDLTDEFDRNIEEAVAAVHGASTIAERPRKAWGTFDEDVSEWTLAWLPGREVLATEVRSTDRKHPGTLDFEGRHLRIANASASEAWMAQRLDRLVAYEREMFDASRPVAFSSWLELDPIRHPSEGSASGKDVAQVDLGKIEPFDLPGGYFVSYHVYPYYPNFVNEDPEYQSYFDELGPVSYRGMLEALRRHHAGTPLFVAEFGVPSSWGRAHSSRSGMHHGGLDEATQGLYAARMMRHIFESGAAGGAWFQWTDGWWKRIWITNPITFPAERLRLWHDMMNAQQHYGLISFQLPDPDFKNAPSTEGTRRIRQVRAAFDAEFVHLRIDLDAPLTDADRLVVGLDTYADDRGETLLSDGTRTTLRSEFALTITTSDTAELKVLRSYDLFSIRERHPPETAHFRSTASDSGDWVAPLWRISAAHGSDDGEFFFPAEDHPIGLLRARRSDEPATSHDAVVLDGATVTLRVPWTLLNFSDPTRRLVIDDDRSTPEREVTQTPGIAFAVSLGDALVETPRRDWPAWNVVPATEERLKAGAETFFEKLRSLPDSLD